MFNLDVLVDFLRWLTGSDAHEPQPIYIPIEKEERRNDL